MNRFQLLKQTNKSILRGQEKGLVRNFNNTKFQFKKVMVDKFSELSYEERNEIFRKNLPEKQPGTKGWMLEGLKRKK